MTEFWIQCKDFPDYAVSDRGRVKSVKHERPLKIYLSGRGYPLVGLYKDKKQYSVMVARLVAWAFCPPPKTDYCDTIVHLNGDHTDCRSENLVWRPRWMAMEYHRNRKEEPFSSWTTRIRILETDEIFDSPLDAVKKYGLLEQDIIRSMVESNKPGVWPYGFHFQKVS